MKFKLVEQFNNDIFYRVTRGVNTNKFSCKYPEFFTKNLEYAKKYAEAEEEPIVYTVKLNIENPFGMLDKQQADIFNKEYRLWAWHNKKIFNNQNTGGQLSDEKIFKILLPKKPGEILDLVNADYIYHFLKKYHKEYDGLIVNEGITWDEFKGTLSYVPFYSNQITILDKDYENRSEGNN